MAINKYITLANSDASVTGRYRVTRDGYAPTLDKIGATRYTVTGAIDNQVGPVRQSWHFIIKVYYVESVAEYDNLSNLQSLFELNDPSASPSNVITFIDHFGTSHDVYMTGSFAPRPITLDLDGASGSYLVDIQLEETEAI